MQLLTGDWLLAAYRPLRPPRQRHGDVTGSTQQSIVLQAALTSAVRDWNDVIGLPARPCRTPEFSRGAVASRRLRSRPCAMSLNHVESADLTDPFVALLDLLANIPGAASDLPLV